ncbi:MULTISPECIES: porin [unclassified Duganella]|uniref:porin n=1 Tax=unclassified Duganella TaxID=2636909 RepID=UPI0006FBEB2A|nr:MULTISPECIES: porin [unclassified Duganella]KQV55540.1 porin [Duganella sp. Root336D2]KRC02605.1 porin [Duganella sp. Root198D2]
MKKSLLALALMGAFSSAAFAQSSVTIYGTLDAGITRTTHTANSAIQEAKRDNNKLGFRGVEDLGSGLKALFHLEIRFESDTGSGELGPNNASRPLFQGQSRVGLQGGFGTIRAGRALTSLQETSTQFEPWSGMPNQAGFQTDIMVSGYRSSQSGSGSDPLGTAGNSGNRFSNAIWYNTPVWNGFQLNVNIASKENNGLPTAIVGRGTPAAPQYPVGSLAGAYPYSVSATYMAPGTAPQWAIYAGTERNATEVKWHSIGAYYRPIPELKLMASYGKQDLGHILASNDGITSWMLGANYNVGPGKFLIGYGQKDPDGQLKTRQFSVGYEYNLSPRTYLYLDLSQKKLPLVSTAIVDTSQNHYALGIHHNF